MRKIYSFLAALLIGFLCVSPPEFYKGATKMAMSLGANDPLIKGDYDIKVWVNSFFWLYAIIAAALIGFFMIAQSKTLPVALKTLLAYLFISCFFSLIPYYSFNAFLMVVCTYILFLWFMHCEFDVIFGMCEAVFWLELVLAWLRLFKLEVLMNIGRNEPIFWGTVFQHMRFASLLCILSPFMIARNKLYIFPIILAIVATTSSGFALSIAAGLAVYALLQDSVTISGKKFLLTVKTKAAVVASCIGASALYALTIGRDSFRVAFVEGRIPVWGVVMKSWMFDTMRNFHGFGSPLNPPVQTGPFDLKSLLFGHGMDSFYSLFQFYKYDPNPFPQAHNSWLQLGWEIGLVGLLILGVWYIGDLIRRLYEKDQHECIAGLAVIGTNMIFHFPDRMTQTVPLMVAYLAFCEIMARTIGEYYDYGT